MLVNSSWAIGALGFYMSEGLKLALTALAGVAVFTVGQIIQKLFIEPIQEHRRGIGRAIYVLDYYSNWPDGLSWDVQKEAHLKIMDAASNLSATLRVIPLYGIFALMTLVPKRSKIEKVNQELVNLARDVNYDSLMNSASVIRNELKRLM